MSYVLKFIGASILAFAVVSALWVAGGFVGLWWYPYSIQRQTAIVRQSNGYITAKQEEMVTLLVGYNRATTEAQRRAIMLQICQDAVLIPGYVPPSIIDAMSGECGR